MDDKQTLAALTEKVDAIKANTDKIPDMTTMLAVHEFRINAMTPKVESHESSIQRAYGIAGFTGLIGALFSYLIGARGVH